MIAQTVSRRDTLKWISTSGAGLALASCGASAITPAGRSVTPGSPESGPEALLEKMAWRLLDFRPESATSLGIDKDDHAGLRARLEDKTPGGIERLVTLLRRDLDAVRTFDGHRLDPATRTSIAVVESAYRIALEGYAQPYGDVAVGGWRNTPYVVIQNVGVYLDIPRFLDSDHPVRNTRDAEAYLSRLNQVAAQFDGETERLTLAEAAGLIPPDFLLDRTLAQMEQTSQAWVHGGSLVHSLTRRTAEFPGNWEERAKRIVTTEIMPALMRQSDALRRLRTKAQPDPGISARPHGDTYYGWALKAGTTTELASQAVHELGLAELAELHSQMDPILRSLGYTKGSVGARMAGLSRDPRFMFAKGDPGRAEIMGFIRQRIGWIRAQMPRAFRELARGNVEVRRLPLAEEPGAPGAYGGAGSIDGSIPGKMWINLRTTDLHRKYDLPTLVHHETIPGHVWQGEYANRLPLIRSVLSFNAFSEGWALYGEQLADELGAYEDDPIGRLGFLQSLAFRACRMVVDTGLHSRGWPRERAIRCFMDRNGNKREEVESEVDRYCSWPGQACGYKMGHSEILRQREHAKSELGSGYDLRDFNQAVVDGGNVPLTVLASNVARLT